jgi:hypothetical protein
MEDINETNNIKKELKELAFKELELKEYENNNKIDKLRKELYMLETERDNIRMYKIQKCEHKLEKISHIKKRYYERCINCDYKIY